MRFDSFDAVEDGIFFELNKDGFQTTTEEPKVDIEADKLVEAFLTAQERIRAGVLRLTAGHPCSAVFDAMCY